MSKITTPLSVLMLFYLMIVGISFIILILAITVACDLSNYDPRQKEYAGLKNCKIFLDKQDYGLFNSCYNQVIGEK